MELKDLDSEDIEDLLIKVEDSFGIRFADNELGHVRTFGELCDHIKDKIHLQKVEDCTSQQAFYKLRLAFCNALQIGKEEVTPNTFLFDLLPSPYRRTKIASLEENLGFKLSLLRPHYFITSTIAILAIASLVGLFFNWTVGLAGLAIAIGGGWLANKIGEELKVDTVGQLADKITQENYLKARRNPSTFNEKEINELLKDWFSNHLKLDKSKLSREAKLI
ncbi:MAG: acyl carrier protein [Flavobacteriales bacterium]|nr:acyl carrier protein [Flavobacteriales bacterium]